MVFLQGLFTGGSLIIAIGAQNAFVLSNGIRNNYAFTVALICSLCDALLISVGVLGVGSAATMHPALAQCVLWAGILFLTVYGLRSLGSALNNSSSLKTTACLRPTYFGIIAATLAVTLLNPHVYLDTMFLIGSISSPLSGQNRILFAFGAITASFIWFFTLSLGAKKLAAFFQTSRSWQILDFLVGLTMLAIAMSLIVK